MTEANEVDYHINVPVCTHKVIVWFGLVLYRKRYETIGSRIWLFIVLDNVESSRKQHNNINIIVIWNQLFGLCLWWQMCISLSSFDFEAESQSQVNKIPSIFIFDNVVIYDVSRWDRNLILSNAFPWLVSISVHIFE